ncbi:MAG: glycerol acyltransferase [Chloroflexi bacterium]|nr:MAG: glycerol acyltransferase [Chloroflexota bacterium]MBL1197040.1 glycerol acyltransferase [Chloroflexota bacterium]NOH14335.1 glycerol acyltransferase [Chloroflexota bacterium]
MPPSQTHLPYCTPLQTRIGKTVLRLTGWKVEGEAPAVNKCVAVFAPHTSNWDFIYMLAAVYVLGIRPNWFGKQELFDSALGPVFRRLGGIGIDRSAKRNRVQQTVEAFRQEERIILGITPEGTRSRATYWKTGFYNIATQAQIPILLIYADYARKCAGVGPLIEPTGDLEADLQTMADFFNQVTPKFPEEVGPITIRPQTI